VDHYQKIQGEEVLEDHYVQDSLTYNWVLDTDIESAIADGQGTHSVIITAGKKLGIGSDGITVIIGDLPAPKSPDGPGTRDDDDQTAHQVITFGYYVRMPYGLWVSSIEPVVPLSIAYGWTRTYHFTVGDQRNEPLPGVAITENPVAVCQNYPGHNTFTHLDASPITNSATTDALGQFMDMFGVTVQKPQDTTQTVLQTYTVTYGTYDSSFMYYIKINHWRLKDDVPTPGTAASFGGPFSDMTCTTPSW
jgi:hypothetical protein